MENLKKNILPLLLVGALSFASFKIGQMTKEIEILKNGGIPSVANQPQRPEFEADSVEPITEDENIYGNKNAKVALIEYSDFECPYCKTFHKTAQQVVDESEGNLKWVFRHFPLESIHFKARTSAIASECVAREGGNEKFWEFSNMIFEGVAQDEGSLAAAASELGVNITECLANSETNDLVEEDIQSGFAAGITGTPGNIILNEETGDAVLIPGALPPAQLTQAIKDITK